MGGGADRGDETSGRGDSDEGQRPHTAGDDGRGFGGRNEEDVPELQKGHCVQDSEGGDDGKGCLGSVCLHISVWGKGFVIEMSVSSNWTLKNNGSLQDCFTMLQHESGT